MLVGDNGVSRVSVLHAYGNHVEYVTPSAFPMLPTLRILLCSHPEVSGVCMRYEEGLLVFSNCWLVPLLWVIWNS